MPPTLERKPRSLEQLTCDSYNDDPTRVRRVAREMPPDDVFDRTGVLLKAIVDPMRVRILYALTIEPLCVCEMATLLDVSMPAISHHLKILTASGLLKIRKEGKFACYYLREEYSAGIVGALLHNLAQSKQGGRDVQYSIL